MTYVLQITTPPPKSVKQNVQHIGDQLCYAAVRPPFADVQDQKFTLFWIVLCARNQSILYTALCCAPKTRRLAVSVCSGDASRVRENRMIQVVPDERRPASKSTLIAKRGKKKDKPALKPPGEVI